MSNSSLQFKFANVKLHPATIKYLEKGHPWVTEDSYTKKFLHTAKFLFSSLNSHSFAVLLHDPIHPKVKARIWSLENRSSNQISLENFEAILFARLKDAIIKRSFFFEGGKTPLRQNFYLFFGEADLIPGLHGLLIGQVLIIQDFTNSIWSEHLAFIFSQVKQIIKDLHGFTISHSIYQKRPGPFLDFPQMKKSSYQTFSIQEFGVSYFIDLGLGGDFGIYTDMSAIREDCKELCPNAHVLNLFSYTGAFSLFALKNGAASVTSVDLSAKYMARLEENLKLNSEIDSSLHTSIIGAARPEVQKMHEQKKDFFDFIICDPPTSSSDGDQRQNNWKVMSDFVIDLDQILKKDGHLLLFNNTHQISRKKFEADIIKLKENNVLKNYKIMKFVGLKKDCPLLKPFIEGDYLKGVLLKKK